MIRKLRGITVGFKENSKELVLNITNEQDVRFECAYKDRLIAALVKEYEALRGQ